MQKWLGMNDLMEAPPITSGMMKWGQRNAVSDPEPSPAPQLRVVRMRPKDARTVSDLNWEGSRAVSSVARKSRRSALLQDPRSTTSQGDDDEPAPSLTQVGPFYSYGYIPEKQLTMLRDIVHWFKDDADMVALADMISERTIPLKLYDWFVAHYTKEFRMSREVVGGPGAAPDSVSVVDIHHSYWVDRWAVRKRHWDFLCKRIKVAFRAEGKEWVTSITQLNAFVFVKRFRLKELLLEHLDAVKAHYEKGKLESENAAHQAALQAAREAGIDVESCASGGVPLKRKRGRRRKNKSESNDAFTSAPMMLSECSVKTRLSLQD
jgi:hypothetical protein